MTHSDVTETKSLILRIIDLLYLNDLRGVVILYLIMSSYSISSYLL